MRRFAARIAALSLAFLVGAAATYVFHKYYIRFETFAVGSCRIGPDGYGGFTSYKSYDGVKLSFERVMFPSHESAASAYQNILKDAAQVVEREPLYGRGGGGVVGERVLAIFPPNEYMHSVWASVVCLDGDRLYRISSPSLRHVRAFDKAARNY